MLNPRQQAQSLNQAAEFCCYLDGQPDHLTPEHHLESYWTGDIAGHPLFWNQNCRLTRAGRLPREITGDAEIPGSFEDMENMAWVRNPTTGALSPFWLGPKMQSMLESVQDGESVPHFNECHKRSLVLAGVLVSENQERIRNERQRAMLSRAANEVRRKGYAPVAELIHPFQISALRRYFRYCVRTGKFTLGDRQSPQRYHAHNDSVAQFFHFQLTKTVSMIVGQPVKPSYVYFASYQEGACLEKHTDREQCQFSISLCLDYSPEPTRQTPWPLQLHTPGGLTTVYQSIGDGLVYLGCQLPHSRGRLPSGHTSTSIFFHYVPQDFNGTLV